MGVTSRQQRRRKILVFVGMLADQNLAETDFRVSIAGIRLQTKIIKTLKPDVLINLIPEFLNRTEFSLALAPEEITFSRFLIGPRFIRVISKIFFDILQFSRLVIANREATVIFYNIDYHNVFLIMISIVSGRKTFVIAADFVSPATTAFERLILWVYRRVYGVVLLRASTNVNSNFTLLPAIADAFPTHYGAESKGAKTKVLFSGSLGKTTGLDLTLQAAIDCPQVEFYFSGRPYHISEEELRQKVESAKSRGANVEYLGMLSYEEYLVFLNQADLALSLRDPSDPNHRHNFPSKIAEYMSAGKVVISSLKYPELAPDSYIYIDFCSTQLAEVLHELEQDAVLREKLSERAKQFVNEQFSSANARAVLEKFFELD